MRSSETPSPYRLDVPMVAQRQATDTHIDARPCLPVSASY